MITSMTGYGRGESSATGLTVSVDVQCLNSRFFDFSAKLPRALQSLEAALRSASQKPLLRGKVVLVATVTQINDESPLPVLARSRIAAYKKIFAEIGELAGIDGQPGFADFLNLPDIFEEEDTSRAEKIKDLLWQAHKEALEVVQSMRRAEGQNLLVDLQERATLIRTAVERVAQKSAEAKSDELEKLRARIKELVENVAVDEARLAQEVAIIADKRDITEECIRMHSHLDQFTDFLESTDPVGKRLGFLLQEMAREVNTIGSKSSHIEISHAVVDLKDELEKMREQVQNIL